MIKTTKYFSEDFLLDSSLCIKGNLIILVESAWNDYSIPSLTYITTLKKFYINNTTLDFLQEKLLKFNHKSITSISTIEFDNELTLCSEFLKLIKLYDPRLFGKEIIDKSINELHKNQIYSIEEFLKSKNKFIYFNINENSCLNHLESISTFNNLEHYLRYLYAIDKLNFYFDLDKLINKKQDEIHALREILF